MSDERVTIDWPEGEDEQTEVFDPGPDPYKAQRAFLSLKERHGPDFEAALEDACAMSDELAALYRDEALLNRPFARRIERLDEVIARAEERVERLRGQKAALETNRDAALKPNRESREWRIARLTEFRWDYAERLRLKKSARSMRLTGGTLKLGHHNPKVKLVEQVAQDGTVLEGKTDRAALMEGLAALRRVGLHDAYEALVETKADVVIADVKRILKVRKGRPVIELHVRGANEGLVDRVAAEGGEAWPQIDRATGEVIGYDVTLPAVQVIRNAATGEVVMERPLVREVAPVNEWTPTFVPSEPGAVPTPDADEDPEEGIDAEAED